MFGRKKRRERELADALAGDAPYDRLLTAIHGGAHTVIDGDAVARYGWPHLSTNEQRNALIDYCRTIAKVVSVDASVICVFFDQTVDDAVPRSKAITIEAAEDRNAAAERALEAIELAEMSVAVWGNDPNAASLRAAGATVFALDDLLDGFLDLPA